MNDSTLPPPSPVTAPVAAARTKNQIKASSIADGVALRAKWKVLAGDARSVWTKLAPEELAKIDGDFHRLAGLVQLRYQLTRAESDQQVRDFFARHALAVG